MAEAVYRALLRSFPPAQRSRYGGEMLQAFAQDLRHAVRSLTRSWTFTLVCVFSVAIGLGINAALALLMYGTLAPPQAVDADSAVELVVLTQGRALDDIWSYADFDDVKRSDTGLDVTGWTVGTRQLRVADGSDGAELYAMYVSANYFRTLGIEVAVVRTQA